MIELWVIFTIWGVVCYKIGFNKGVHEKFTGIQAVIEKATKEAVSHITIVEIKEDEIGD